MWKVRDLCVHSLYIRHQHKHHSLVFLVTIGKISFQDFIVLLHAYRCICWLEYENAYRQAILTLTWIHWHVNLVRCFSGTPPPEHSQNLCAAVPVMGFLLLHALVSQKEPKLALSGRLSSLVVLTQCPVTHTHTQKESSNIPFCYNFHLLGGAVSFFFLFFVLTLVVRSSQVQELSVDLGGLVRLHSIPVSSLHDPYVRMHCLPVCLSVCPTLHISTRDQALKDVSTFTVSKLSYLFYCFILFLLGEFGCFPCCAFTCRIWNHHTWKTSVEYFTKKKEGKKRYLALVTQTIDFIVFM